VRAPTGPVCARCPAALGASCCEVKEDERLATLTRADVERIAAHTGLSTRRFVGRYGDLAEARAGGSACLAVEEAESMEDVLATFGTTRETVEELGAQLAQETREHGRG